MLTGNLLANAAPPAIGERFETLLRHRNLVVERIISSSAPEASEYIQQQDEWVVVIQGEARLNAGAESVALTAGDYLFLPAGTPHAVEYVAEGTIWLAIHLYPDEPRRA